jgi:hypothetical protein
MLAQHVSHGLIAPRWRSAAKEESLRKFMLAAGNGGLIRAHAALSDEALNRRNVFSVRRPCVWNQQRMQFAIRSVDRQRL